MTEFTALFDSWAQKITSDFHQQHTFHQHAVKDGLEEIDQLRKHHSALSHTSQQLKRGPPVHHTAMTGGEGYAKRHRLTPRFLPHAVRSLPVVECEDEGHAVDGLHELLASLQKEAQQLPSSIDALKQRRTQVDINADTQHKRQTARSRGRSAPPPPPLPSLALFPVKPETPAVVLEVRCAHTFPHVVCAVGSAGRYGAALRRGDRRRSAAARSLPAGARPRVRAQNESVESRAALLTPPHSRALTIRPFCPSPSLPLLRAQTSCRWCSRASAE